jgi:uroporphyrinogen-III synthase
MSTWKILSTTQLEAPVINSLHQAGIGVIEKELIRIKPSVPAVTEKIKSAIGKTVVFTSSNAVDAVKAHLAEALFDVFCMRGRTKKAIQENFSNAMIIDTADSSVSIAEKIVARGTKEVIFFCGDLRRDELPALLKENNVAVQEVIVYTTEETPCRIDETYDAVLFFSPSAVRSFFAANTLNETTPCFSIGTTTAAEIKKYTTNKIIVADIPAQEALAAKITEHFKRMVQS